MEKKRIEIIVTFALGLVFILAAANSCREVRKRPIPATPVKPGIASQPKALSLPPQSSLAGDKRTQPDTGELQWGEDPFSGKVYLKLAEDKEDDFIVSGIVWDKDKPTAIVNNKVCETGSRVGGYTVVAIKEDRVVLSDGFQVFEKRIGK